MDLTLRIALSAGIICYLIFLFSLLSKKRINLKYSLVWIMASLVIILVMIFPTQFMLGIKRLGVVDPVNGLLAIVSFLIIVILMSLTSIVSVLNDKNRRLAQEIALLDKRLRDLEAGRHKEE